MILSTMRALPRSIRMLSPIVDFVVTFENEEVRRVWFGGAGRGGVVWGGVVLCCVVLCCVVLCCVCFTVLCEL